MTDARVERVHANRADARVFLEQAKSFQADNGPLSRESAAVLLHNAVISGADPILQAARLRVTGGDGASEMCRQLRLSAAAHPRAVRTPSLSSLRS